MYCYMRINMIMLGFSFLILSLISPYFFSPLRPLMFHKITFIDKEGGIVKKTLEINVILCEVGRRFLVYCINSYVVFLPHHLYPLIGFRGPLKSVILCELARRFLDYCINSYVVFLPHHLSPLIGFRGSLKCQEREEREPC